MTELGQNSPSAITIILCIINKTTIEPSYECLTDEERKYG